MLRQGRTLARLLFAVCLVAFLSVGAQAKVQVTVYDWATGKSAEGLQMLIDEFNATHPDVEVQYAYKGPTSQNLMEALSVSLLGGSPPEISVAFETHVQQLWPAYKDRIVPTQSFIQAGGLSRSEQADFVPMTAQALNVGGVQVALPFRFEGSMLAVNVDTLQQAGMRQYPETWEGVVSESRKLARDTNGDGVPERVSAGWLDPASWVWAPFLWGAGGDFFNENNTRATFGSAAGLRAATYFGELAQSGVATKASVADFAADRAASIVMGSWLMGEIQQSASFAWNGAFWPYPSNVGPDKVRGLSKVGGLMIFKTTPAKEKAAWTFVKWIIEPENLAKYDVAASWLPVRRGVVGQEVFRAEIRRNPGLKAFMDNLDRFKLTPSFANWVTVDFDVIRPALQKIVTGGVSPESAMADAQRLANEKLK